MRTAVAKKPRTDIGTHDWRADLPHADPAPYDFANDVDLDLWIDFETRSRCNLKIHGVYNYAQDASTKVLCMSYAFGDEPVQTWSPHLDALLGRKPQPFPERVAAYLAKKTGKGRLKAHNATFERLTFWYVVCPDEEIVEPELELFYCTAAESRANCGPGALEDVGRFAGAGMRKDYRGAELIRKLSIPRVDGTFNDDVELLKEMVEYCEQDVRAMRSSSIAFRPLSSQELYDYHVNERINDRGITVDRDLAQATQVYAREELAEIQEIINEVTEGAVPSAKSPVMTQWIYDRVGPSIQRMMRVHKRHKETGEDVVRISMAKDIRANILALVEENHEEVPGEVADMLQCVDDSWATSTAKFLKMDELSDPEDDRMRGALVFAGGAATGRYSSYGAQVHNMGRKVMPDFVAVREAIVARLDIALQFRSRVFTILKKMLRPALMASVGHVLVVADWSSIEARVTPWASRSEAGDDKLEQFRLEKDVYIVNAAATFGVTYEWIADRVQAGKGPEAKAAVEARLGVGIPHDEIVEADRMRQVGKVQELACGFMGSVGAFNNMGRIYGVYLPADESKAMVEAWRRANAWSVPYWAALKKAYMAAMRNEGREFTAGRVTYMFDGTHLWYALPSGRILVYPYARVEKGQYGPEVSYAKASFKPSADAEEWPRSRLWPGLAAENITQAIANDLLREALGALEDEFQFALDDGLLKHPAHIILHVHDEIVAECHEDDADVVKSILKAIMTTPPDWCPTLPLAIGKPSAERRYGK